MSNIFKINPPLYKIINTIINLSLYENNKYIINNNTFKIYNLSNDIKQFIYFLEPFYYKSKQFYVTRKLNYKNYLTIIRQLCNLYNIKYRVIKKYCNSKYEIYYIIPSEQDIFNNVPNKLSALTDCSLDNLENQL
jgi:hypothetical protein